MNEYNNHGFNGEPIMPDPIDPRQIIDITVLVNRTTALEDNVRFRNEWIGAEMNKLQSRLIEQQKQLEEMHENSSSDFKYPTVGI